MKGTGDNIKEAAIQARKMGVSLSATQQIAETFLDFENAAVNTAELNLIAGTKLNALELHRMAISGDILELQEKILGSIAKENRWEDLNILQQKRITELLGISAEETSKLLKYEESLNTIRGTTSLRVIENMSEFADKSARSKLEETYQLQEQLKLYNKTNKINLAFNEKNIRMVIRERDERIKKQKNIDELLRDMQTSWEKIWNTLKSKIYPIFLEIGKWLSDKFNPIVEGVANSINKLIPNVNDIKRAYGENGLFGVILNIFKRIKQSFQPIIDFISEGLKSAFDSLVNYIKENYDVSFKRSLFGGDLIERRENKEEYEKRKQIEINKELKQQGIKSGYYGKEELEIFAFLENDIEALKALRRNLQEENLSNKEIDKMFVEKRQLYNENRSEIEYSLKLQKEAKNAFVSMNKKISFDKEFEKIMSPLGEQFQRENFAQGGLVTKPTRALIGEAGPELIVPLDKLDNMSNLKIEPQTGKLQKFARGGMVLSVDQMAAAGQIANLQESQLMAAGDPVAIRARTQEFQEEARRYREQLIKIETDMYKRDLALREFEKTDRQRFLDLFSSKFGYLTVELNRVLAEGIVRFGNAAGQVIGYDQLGKDLAAGFANYLETKDFGKAAQAMAASIVGVGSPLSKYIVEQREKERQQIEEDVRDLTDRTQQSILSIFGKDRGTIEQQQFGLDLEKYVKDTFVPMGEDIEFDTEFEKMLGPLDKGFQKEKGFWAKLGDRFAQRNDEVEGELSFMDKGLSKLGSVGRLGKSLFDKIGGTDKLKSGLAETAFAGLNEFAKTGSLKGGIKAAAGVARGIGGNMLGKGILSLIPGGAIVANLPIVGDLASSFVGGKVLDIVGLGGGWDKSEKRKDALSSLNKSLTDGDLSTFSAPNTLMKSFMKPSGELDEGSFKRTQEEVSNVLNRFVGEEIFTPDIVSPLIQALVSRGSMGKDIMSSSTAKGIITDYNSLLFNMKDDEVNLANLKPVGPGVGGGIEGAAATTATGYDFSDFLNNTIPTSTISESGQRREELFRREEEIPSVLSPYNDERPIIPTGRSGERDEVTQQDIDVQRRTDETVEEIRRLREENERANNAYLAAVQNLQNRPIIIKLDGRKIAENTSSHQEEMSREI